MRRKGTRTRIDKERQQFAAHLLHRVDQLHRLQDVMLRGMGIQALQEDGASDLACSENIMHIMLANLNLVAHAAALATVETWPAFYRMGNGPRTRNGSGMASSPTRGGSKNG